MATYCTDQAICLRCADFSETSQIVTVFTVAYGLVSGIAKGSKRVPKKAGSAPGPFSGPFDLLNAGQLVFILPKLGGAGGGDKGGGGPTGGSVGGLATITSWQLEDQRRALRQSLPSLQAALLAAEVTLHLLHPYEVQTELYAELEATLTLLTKGGGGGRALVSYVKAVLTAAGYQPHLHACVVCQKPILATGAAAGGVGTVRFAPLAGGVICDDCRSARAPAPRIHQGRTSSPRPAEMVTAVPATLLLALDRLSPPTVLRAQAPERPADPAALRQALELLLDQVQSITDRPLRTRWLVPAIFSVVGI